MTLAAIGLLAAPMSPVAAQSVPIDRLTPQNLAPQQERRSPALESAATGAFNCPAGSGDAVVALGPVKVVGGLPGFEAPRDELVRSLANHPRSLPEICAVAARLERDGEHKHADAKGDLTLLMNAIQTACKVIASAVRKAGIAGLYGMEVTLAALSILLC